jgi:hypothetical protein
MSRQASQPWSRQGEGRGGSIASVPPGHDLHLSTKTWLERIAPSFHSVGCKTIRSTNKPRADHQEVTGGVGLASHNGMPESIAFLLRGCRGSVIAAAGKRHLTDAARTTDGGRWLVTSPFLAGQPTGPNAVEICGRPHTSVPSQCRLAPCPLFLAVAATVRPSFSTGLACTPASRAHIPRR